MILHHKKLTIQNKALCCKEAYNTRIISTKRYAVIRMFHIVPKVEGRYMQYTSGIFCDVYA